MAEKYIIELDAHEINLIAALTHLFIKHNPDAIIGKQLLTSLIEQAPDVSSNPLRHGVGASALTLQNVYSQPAQAGYRVQESIDVSGLTNLLLYEGFMGD